MSDVIDMHHRRMLKAARLIEHRANVMVKAIESGDPNYALQRYRKLGEAWAYFKREFKRSDLDGRA